MFGKSFQPDTGDARLDEALYEVASTFGRTRGSANWGDVRDSSVTLTRPVWDLSEEDYRDFCWHAPYKGDAANTVRAIKYFLPRVAADLVAEGEREVPWTTPHLTSLLSEHGWKTWDMNESMALHGWATAWLRHAILSEEPLRYEDHIVLMAAVLEVNLSAVFAQAKQEKSLSTMCWFARQIERHWQSIMATGWPDGWLRYWGDHAVGYWQSHGFVWFLLDTWQFSDLQDAFFRATDKELQRLLSSAHQHGMHCLEFGKGEPDSPMRNPPTIDFVDPAP